MNLTKSFSDEPISPALYFSLDYIEARRKFIAAAKHASATLYQEIILVDDNGFQYTQDYAVIKGEDKNSLILHLSGTHGVEGYAGSAIQTSLLQNWKELNTGSDSKSSPTVCFVHAVNPYGFHNNRRVNENNVDLNRNLITEKSEWELVLNRDPNWSKYDDFFDFLNPKIAPRPFIDRVLFFVKIVYNIIVHGYTSLMNVLIQGTYHRPKGIYFGGQELQQSHKTIRSFLNKHFTHMKRLAIIDVHTGLGKPGVDTLLVSTHQDEQQLTPIFPNHNKSGLIRSLAKKENTNKETIQDVRGKSTEYARDFKHCKNSIGITQEFGTISGLFVAEALIRENAAYHYAYNSKTHKQAGAALKDVFYPKKLSWETDIIRQGNIIFNGLHREFTKNKKFLS